MTIPVLDTDTQSIHKDITIGYKCSLKAGNDGGVFNVTFFNY